MRRFRIPALLLLPCVLLTLCGSFFLRAEGANAAPAICDTWKVVPSPNYGLDGKVLQAVSASAENNVWAVGYHYTGIGNQKRTYSEYWNGTTWEVVPTPDGGSSTSYDLLNGVVALSSNDVWNVGEYWPSGPGPTKTLIEQWNGQAWSIIPSPNIRKSSSVLNGITAISANNIWAVGNYYTYHIAQTLVEHWDGTKWSVISSPNVGQGSNILYSVAGASANNLWAVGYSGTQTLVEHWDGTKWKVVASPSVGQASNLNSVTIVPGTNDVWAVGFGNGYPSLNASFTLTEYWDGKSWSVITSPNPPPPAGDALTGVVAISSNNVWAVGYSGSTLTVIEHWDGISWSIVANPNPSRFLDALNGATLIPGTTKVWAAGYHQGPIKGSKTLTEVNC